MSAAEQDLNEALDALRASERPAAKPVDVSALRLPFDLEPIPGRWALTFRAEIQSDEHATKEQVIADFNAGAVPAIIGALVHVEHVYRRKVSP